MTMGVPGGQLDGGQRHAQSHHIGEHVPGIGEQGERVGDDPTDGLHHEERGDEHEGDEQPALMPGAGPQRSCTVVVALAHTAPPPPEAR